MFVQVLLFGLKKMTQIQMYELDGGSYGKPQVMACVSLLHEMGERVNYAEYSRWKDDLILASLVFCLDWHFDQVTFVLHSLEE
jgi:hypothetical protein